MAEAPAITLLDERPMVMGLSFELDPVRLSNLMLHVGLPEELLSKVEVHLIDVDPEQPKHSGGVAKVLKKTSHPEVDGEFLTVQKHVVHLRVSDRPEFSEKSVIRINRNLCRALKTLAIGYHLASLAGSEVGGAAALNMALPVWSKVAYDAEQGVKADDSLRPLRPVSL